MFYLNDMQEVRLFFSGMCGFEMRFFMYYLYKWHKWKDETSLLWHLKIRDLTFSDNI